MKSYIIFELDQGVALPTSPYYWVKENSTVHKMTYSWEQESREFVYGLGAWGSGPYGSSGVGQLSEPEVPPAIRAGSLLVDGEIYTPVFSVSECEETGESFYFDIDNQITYVNFKDDSNPWDYLDVSLGVSKGFSNRPVVYDRIGYDPRVLSIPASIIQRDSLYYGKVSFSGGSVTLDNMDHYFDTFDQDDVFGKICRVKYSEDNITYKDVYSGKLADFKLVGDNIVLNLKDPRQALEVEVPTKILSLDDYPNIKDNLIGTEIPVGYGPVIDSPAYSLNEGSTGFFIFKFCLHAVTSISEIRVNNSVVTASSSDLTEGEFTLTSSDYSPGDEVTVDYFGKDITNALDIIEDLLITYSSTLYNDTFFNTSSWEAVKALVPQEIGLGLFEKEKLIDVVGRISGSIRGSFLTDRDSRFNFKIVDNEKDPVLYLPAISYLQPPEVIYNFKEFLSVAQVLYSQGLKNETGPIYTDDSKDTSIFIKYDTRLTQEFPSLLTSSSEAEELAGKFVELFGGVFPYFKIRTKFETLDLELEDIIECQMYEKDNRFYNVRLETLFQSVDFIKREIVVMGRLILYTNQIGEVVNLPRGARLLRRVKRDYAESTDFPTDVIIQYDDIPDYIVQYNDDPDYIIQYEE